MLFRKILTAPLAIGLCALAFHFASLTDQANAQAAAAAAGAKSPKMKTHAVKPGATAAGASASGGTDEAQSRAVVILSQQVKAQAYTLSISDGFVLIGWIVVIYLLLMLFLRPGKIDFRILRNMK